MSTRDMSRAEFERAIERHGFKPRLFGYYEVAKGVSVYAPNGGDKRRSQLAYLMQERNRVESDPKFGGQECS